MIFYIYYAKGPLIKYIRNRDNQNQQTSHEIILNLQLNFELTSLIWNRFADIFNVATNFVKDYSALLKSQKNFSVIAIARKCLKACYIFFKYHVTRLSLLFHALIKRTKSRHLTCTSHRVGEALMFQHLNFINWALFLNNGIIIRN